jgi:hypothetical protein
VDAITASAFSTVGDDDLRTIAEELGFEVMQPGTWPERHSSQPEPLKRTAVINVPIADFWMEERHSGTSRDALAVACRPRDAAKSLYRAVTCGVMIWCRSRALEPAASPSG